MKNLGGRPTDYKPIYNKQVEKLCKLGAKDTEIAAFFEISESTLNLWKKKFPKFSESIKKGKMSADANVADSLYQRAVGYKHHAVKILVVDKVVKNIGYTEHFAPDPTSAIFWLKNRSKDKWRDKQEIDHNPNDKPLLVKVISYKDKK